MGLGTLRADLSNLALRCMYEILEIRVGGHLANLMTLEQMDEFEAYFEAKDNAGAFAWLESNFPNYKEIVQDEFAKLEADVAQDAPEILDGVDELLREFDSLGNGAATG